MDFVLYLLIGYVIRYIVILTCPIFYDFKRSEILKVQSTVTGKCYETDECVFIVNPLQVYKYIINDAIPLDILAGEDNKIVYVYNRKSTRDLYDRWCKREL